MILIFGKVAYLEKTKKKLSIIGVARQTNTNTIEKNSVSLTSKNSPYVPNSRNNISKTYKSSTKNNSKRYITESWVCAGKYVKGKYIESRICHRNPNLLANNRIIVLMQKDDGCQWIWMSLEVPVGIHFHFTTTKLTITFQSTLYKVPWFLFSNIPIARTIRT